MEIEIKYCNNIDESKIKIIENKLNIKYAVNGTGKSTISKAILAAVNDRKTGSSDLMRLTPFKALNSIDLKPSVDGVESFNLVKVFDENYINKFIFQPDELIRGSFEIFIRNENYESGMKEIEILVTELKSILGQDKDIADLINDFNELSESFGRQTQSGIHGSSSLSKAFKNGNRVVNIPNGLEVFKDYIQKDNNYKWIKWQIDGKEFIDITDNCPYCVSEIREKKDIIRRVSKEYEPKNVENLNKIIAVFQRLNKYFTDDTKKKIDEFITNVDGYSGDQVDFLREIKDQVDRLNDKFIKATDIGFLSLKDIDKLIEGLKTFKIDVKLYNHLGSECTIEKVDLVNTQIDKLLDKAGQLQGSINKQKMLIQKLVEVYSSEINSFLMNAGFSYKVNLLENENGEYRLKLLHNDLSNELDNVIAHLSYGERNAFAIVLFMYDALKSKPDLIILDDPISSFDKNKKYAIVDMLFRRENCFRGKTVLFLTHDFEPIIDMIVHHKDHFDGPHAVFLENPNGKLLEKEITKKDVKTYIEINKDNISRSKHAICKIIYLRRLFEIVNDKGMAYQIISSLIHKRDMPTINDREITADEMSEGVTQIKEYIHDFNYNAILMIIKSDNELVRLYRSASSNYEKLHLYRIIFHDKADRIESNVIKKFINQSYHTENEYIYQLDPSRYQTVPQYVIMECDKFISKMG